MFYQENYLELADVSPARKTPHLQVITPEEDVAQSLFVQHSSDNFTKWLLTITATILVAGVIAMWTLSSNVAKLEERVANWTQVFQTRLDSYNGTLKEIQDKQESTQQMLVRDHDRIDRLDPLPSSRAVGHN